MQFGTFMFVGDQTMSIVDLASATEERGFESLWVPEHTHIPASRRSPYRLGGELPPEYYHLLDPFIALGAAAGVTTRILLGTAICLVVERDPITLAKEVTSLDFLSGGRFQFGIGGGWNREEMENHGTDPTKRWAIMRERIEAMKQIWTQDEAEYHGRFVNFDPIWQWPKPIQKPYPPIWVGGDGPGTLPRVVRYGDGWFPNVAGKSPSALGERIKELERLSAEAGRGGIPVTAFGVSPRSDQGALESYLELGVERVIFSLPPASADATLPVMDELAKKVETLS